jgi:hypothetical protein
MFRKLLLASVMSLEFVAPLAIPTNAEAHEFRNEHRHRHNHRLYYHDPCRPGWVCAGTFRDYGAAIRFAESYRCRGFTIWIR